jgi:ATP:ADP antiporter, AAA family
MIRRWVDIRPDEYRNLLGAFLTLFGIMAAHALMETARDALFLANLPASQLPWIYMAVAVLTLLIVKSRQKMLYRFEGRNCMSILLLNTSVFSALLWHFSESPSDRLLYILYAWPAIFATLVITSFWTMMSSLMTITQAKRLFAPIGAGGILGAIAGSALARYMAVNLEPRHLLLAAGLILLSSTQAPSIIHQATPRRKDLDAEDKPHGLLEDIRVIWRRPYLKRITTLILVSTVTATILDYLFKATVAANVPADYLAQYFSAIYLVLNLASLLAQLFLVSWLVRTSGVTNAIVLLPVFLVLCGGWFVVGGAVMAIMLTRGFDGALRHSLNRTALEMLYVPLPDDLRNRFKSISDVVGQRGGQALASLMILAVLATGWGERLIGMLLVALAIVWIVLALRMRRHYLNMIRHTIDIKSPLANGLDDELDMSSLEVLLTTLNSADDVEVLTALDLLARKNKAHLIPMMILYHPSTPVVVAALDIFVKTRRKECRLYVARLLKHDDFKIRAGVLRTIEIDDDNEAVFHTALNDDSPEVRSTALVSMINYGILAADEIHSRLDTLLTTGTSRAHAALALSIAEHPNKIFKHALITLAGSYSQKVRSAVAVAMKHMPDEDFMPVLLPMLVHASTRRQAREAMVQIGEPALKILEAAMTDIAYPYEVHLHIPRSISRFPAEDAMPVLLRNIQANLDTSITFKIIRALGRLRADNPKLAIDTKLIDEIIAYMIMSIYRLIDWRVKLDAGVRRNPGRATPVQSLLTSYLEDTDIRAREWLLRLLGLRYPIKDINLIVNGLESKDRSTFAGSLELLSETLPLTLRHQVLGLLDKLAPAERLLNAPATYTKLSGDYELLLTDMLDSIDTHLHCLVAYHVGELGIMNLRQRLESLGQSRSSTLAEVSKRALNLLDNPELERISY